MLYALRDGSLPLVGTQSAADALNFLSGPKQSSDNGIFTQLGRRDMPNPILLSGMTTTERGRALPKHVYLPTMGMATLGRPVSWGGFGGVSFIPEEGLVEERLLAAGYTRFTYSASHLVGDHDKLDMDPAISRFSLQFPPFDDQVHKVFDLSEHAGRTFTVIILKTPTAYFHSESNVYQFSYRAIVLDEGRPRELPDSSLHNGGPGYLEVKTELGRISYDTGEGDFINLGSDGSFKPRIRITSNPVMPENTDEVGLAALGLGMKRDQGNGEFRIVING